ncbi:MAG TPA: M48 family metallopeptidase, partial [bacterium]|nr:M48 family metallopeptidase [bacterium]
PALGERVLARAGQVTQAATAAVVVLLFLPSPISNWLIPVVFVGAALGGFHARRRLLDETWSFGQYLTFMVRFWIAWIGFWMGLAASPSIVFSTGDAAPVAAPVVAALLIGWYARQHALFIRILGARPLELPAHLRVILVRSRVGTSTFWRIPVAGGRLATAFAVPSPRTPAVAFSDTVVESLTEDEQGAVYAHELAHLERIAATRRTGQEWSIIGALILTGSFGPLLPGAALWMVLAWVVGILLFFGKVMAQNRKAEEASDRRAVELCGDAGALERALIKLTVLARLPRRWSLDFESASTHPSLAKRIQAIRNVGAATSPHAPAGTAHGDVLQVASRAGTPIVFGADHLEWTEREEPRRAAYGELGDLRIDAGLRAAPSLHVTAVSGRSWNIPLDPRMVADVQAALDRVDARLGTMTTRRTQQWLTRGLALTLLALAWLAPLMGREVAMNISPLAAGAVGVISPGLAALVAMTVAAGGLAVFNILKGVQGVGMIVTAVLALVAVGTAALAVRDRHAAQSRGSRFTAVLFLIFPFVGSWGPLTAYAFSGEERLPIMAELLRAAPDLWLLPATLAGAVFVSTGGRLRWFAALPIVAAAVVALLASA